MSNTSDAAIPVLKAGSGLVVMLQVPRNVADVIAPAGGESVDLLHVTIAYMGKDETLPPGAFDAVQRAVESVAASATPLTGLVNGVGRFNASESSDGMDVWYASYDSPGLIDLRAALVAAIEAAGVPVQRNHGYVPHITLKYVYPHDQEPLPTVPTTALDFAEVTVALGGDVHRIPLGRPPLPLEREPGALDHLGVDDSGPQVFLEIDEPRLMALRMLGFNVIEKEADEPVRCKVLKSDPERRLVYGVVLSPYEVDTQGHTMTAEDVEYAAHHYLGSNGIMSIRHKAVADACCVESYIAPIDFEIGGQRVLAGDWVLVSYVRSDELWARIVAGDYQGYSVGGFGKMTDVK